MDDMTTAVPVGRVSMFLRLLGYGAAAFAVFVLTSQLNDPTCEGCDYVAGLVLLLLLAVLGRSDWDD